MQNLSTNLILPLFSYIQRRIYPPLKIDRIEPKSTFKVTKSTIECFERALII